MGITEDTRRESFEQLDSTTINSHIVSILTEGSPMTAREIALTMYEQRYIPFQVRQAVAPRLTELEQDGIVEAVGKVWDDVTKRSVAAYKLVK